MGFYAMMLRLHTYRSSLLHRRILLGAHHLDVSRVAEIGCISPIKATAYGTRVRERGRCDDASREPGSPAHG